MVEITNDGLKRFVFLNSVRATLPFPMIPLPLQNSSATVGSSSLINASLIFHLVYSFSLSFLIVSVARCELRPIVLVFFFLKLIVVVVSSSQYFSSLITVKIIFENKKRSTRKNCCPAPRHRVKHRNRKMEFLERKKYFPLFFSSLGLFLFD